MSLRGVCEAHGNPAGSCFACDYAEETRLEAIAFRAIWLYAGAIVLLSLLCFALGCSTEAPSLDDAGADTGSPPDVHEPQCRALAQGEEFFAATSPGAAPALLLNQCCDRVCRNSTGGQTCIDVKGALVDCAACQVGCSP